MNNFLTELPQNQPSPEKRFGHSVTMVSPDRAIIFGGAVGDGSYRITNDVFSYDCVTSKWTILKPKNSEEAPSPRAAHGATTVESNQMVVFGGAHSNGNLVDNDLYLLKLASGEGNGKWIRVPIDGAKPSQRYGHSLVFSKPFILVIGGNIGNEPSIDVWSLSIDRSPFSWNRLDFPSGEPQPLPRVYLGATVWKSKEQVDMIVIFGGRSTKNVPLGDLWGLRRHNNGVWDWVKAPIRATGPQPAERYQHSLLCFQGLVLAIGGRGPQSEELPLNIYSLETSEWYAFQGISRFRHVSWVYKNSLIIHGGFENSKPNLPTDSLQSLDLFELFAGRPALLGRLEEWLATTALKTPGMSPGIFKLSEQVLVAHFAQERGVVQYVPLSELAQEPNKVIDYLPPSAPEESRAGYLLNLHSTVLRYLFKPGEWKYQEGVAFPLRSEIIIALCDEAIKILKTSSTLVKLRPGVKIFGSIHGQFGDMLRFFQTHGVPDTDPSFDRKSDIEALDYLFLGNYVDRGRNSLEVICTLLALKLKYPKQIHLLRGSHEDAIVNSVEGLGQECQVRLAEDIRQKTSVFAKLNSVFEYLPLAAVIGERIFCAHSGIGTALEKIDQIERIRRPLELKHVEPFTKEQKLALELLWSDPVLDAEQSANTGEGREGPSGKALARYGTDRIAQFLETNNLQIIIRSHECCPEGAEELGDTNLYTVFSCTDYCGIHNNDAAIFLYHRNNQKLSTLTIPLIKGMTKWYNMSLLRRTESKSQTIGEEDHDLKNRSVTPPRRITKHKSIND